METETGVVLRTPNEMFDKAKELVLENREPETTVDWILVIEFWTCNVVLDAAVPMIKFMCHLYECPLSDHQIENVVEKTMFKIMLSDLLMSIDR